MKALVPFAAVITFSILLLGQVAVPAGSIAGTVQDQSGAVIPGVTVTALGPRGTVSVVTDQTGSYTLPNLSVGTYVVTASLPGFADTRFLDVEVRTGIALRLTFTMRVQVGPGPMTPIPPSPRDRNLNIVADTQTTQGSTILYRGNVQMTTDSMQLIADELDFNTRTLSADARGNVKVRVLPVMVRTIPLSGEK